MESIVAKAFKSSTFFSEVATKPLNSQALGVGDDYLIISPAATAGEDFSVDEFFDLQGLSGEENEEEEEEEEKSSSSSSSCVSSQDQIDEGSSFPGGFSGTGFSGSFSGADGLTIPVDDHMQELELWSHLMDETHCEDVYIKTVPNVEKWVRFEPVIKPATFPPPIPVKPRTKRFKTATAAWSNCSLLKTGYSSESGSDMGTGPRKSKKTGIKEPERKPAVLEDGGLTGPVQLRRCTHCQVQKTPQWRTGPFGPKTLCNACGVRFKSGRLFPEYRPACSPTFTSEIHSNSHRKVVEMRRKKKMAEPSGPDFASTILSC